MNRPDPPPAGAGPSDREVRRALARTSRRGFAIWAGSLASGAALVRWVATRSESSGLAWPLRRVLRLDESVARGLFAPGRRVREFPASGAREPRVNGPIGLTAAVDLANYRLRVEGGTEPDSSRMFRPSDLAAMPQRASVNELKCVEGWSQVVGWSGVALADLAASTGLASRSGRPYDPARPPADLYRYVALETPDAAYYVGLDMAAALHPQSILCLAMNGRPLTEPHGAPVRLAIPIKYGIKNLKRIGTIRFTDDRPRDYWAERGYDWYAGL